MSANAGAGEPEADREVIITRTYDAPARLLFEAWSKPEHLKQWFGPVGYPVTMCEMDFRKGGQWRAADDRAGRRAADALRRRISRDRAPIAGSSFRTARAAGAEKMIWTVTLTRRTAKTLLTHPHPVRLDRPEGGPMSAPA